jgi:hypothetical protein
MQHQPTLYYFYLPLISKLISKALLLHKKKKNSMVWVRERTIPTERPQLVSEVIANFCDMFYRKVMCPNRFMSFRCCQQILALMNGISPRSDAEVRGVEWDASVWKQWKVVAYLNVFGTRSKTVQSLRRRTSCKWDRHKLSNIMDQRSHDLDWRSSNIATWWWPCHLRVSQATSLTPCMRVVR